MGERLQRSAGGIMRCPRCETGQLDERERDGILVDVCRSCRGMWLDRGELEKLIARATREFDEPEYGYARHDDTPPRGYHIDDGDRGRSHPKRKKRWFESFGDIFD